MSVGRSTQYQAGPWGSTRTRTGGDPNRGKKMPDLKGVDDAHIHPWVKFAMYSLPISLASGGIGGTVAMLKRDMLDRGAIGAAADITAMGGPDNMSREDLGQVLDTHFDRDTLMLDVITEALEVDQYFDKTIIQPFYNGTALQLADKASETNLGDALQALANGGGLAEAEALTAQRQAGVEPTPVEELDATPEAEESAAEPIIVSEADTDIDWTAVAAASQDNAILENSISSSEQLIDPLADISFV